MFSDPEAVVPYFGLVDGTVVADFGAGSGHYALAMARRVGDRGKVYAIDVQKELLSRLEAEAKQAGIRNINIVWGNVEKAGGTKLADQSVDVVIIANMLLQTDAKYSVALEAKRILRASGKVAVIDWKNKTNPEEIKQIFAQAGFSFVKDFPAGNEHYGLELKKE